jgi:hypothetical protein
MLATRSTRRAAGNGISSAVPPAALPDRGDFRSDDTKFSFPINAGTKREDVGMVIDNISRAPAF